MTMIRLNGQNYDITAFICDSVRTENDGRNSIIGISPGPVQAVVFPMTVQVGIFAKIKPNPPTGTSLKLEIRLDDTVLFAPESFPIPVEPAEDTEDRAIQIVVDRLMLNVAAPGRLGLYLGFDDAPPEQVTSVRYIIAPGNPDLPQD